MSEKKLNPDITPVDIGIEELREIKIYPLSLNDHTEKLPELLVTAWNEFQAVLILIADVKNLSNEEGLELIKKFKELLVLHLDKLLELVVKKEERPKPEEMTSNQLYRIAEIIFEVNYEGVLKNSVNLFKRATTFNQ